MKPGPTRGSFVVAAEAARGAFSRAAQARPPLGSRDHRVLEAAVSLVTLYSRTEDRVYLGHLAAEAFGVEVSTTWQQKKAGDSLRRLAAAGVIVVEAPKGRPTAPAYVVRFPLAAAPATGVAEEPEEDPIEAPEEQPAAPAVGVPDDDAADPAIGVAGDDADEPTETLCDASNPRRGSVATPAVVDSDPRRGAPTGEYPGEYPGETETSAAEADASTDPKALARSIVTAWWDERKAAGNPVAQKFIACVKVVETMLSQGVEPRRIEFALRDALTVSTGALEFSIQRELKRREAAPPVDKRDARVAATLDLDSLNAALGRQPVSALAAGDGQ